MRDKMVHSGNRTLKHSLLSPEGDGGGEGVVMVVAEVTIGALDHE